MRLNSKKYVFGVWFGKFLGFMITSKGIEANLDNVKVVLDMRPLRNVKEVQRLTSCVTALGHFMSKAANKFQSFFHILQKHTLRVGARGGRPFNH